MSNHEVTHFISHRGNSQGRDIKRENTLKYLWEAIEAGFDVEVDVRMANGVPIGMHDEKFSHYTKEAPKERILEKDFLLHEGVWCHAKDWKAVEYLDKIGAHWFWHDQEERVSTSKGYIWTYPKKELIMSKKCICVLPEQGFQGDFSRVGGICSDYIDTYFNIMLVA
jgi:hypothetical protein